MFSRMSLSRLALAVLCCTLSCTVPAKSLRDILDDLLPDKDKKHESSSSSLLETVYMKAQTCSAVVFEGDDVIGLATVKTTKASKSIMEKKVKFRLAVTVEFFDSRKKLTAKEDVSFKEDKHTDEYFTVEDTLEFKSPLGNMPFEFGYDRDLGIYLRARNSNYTILTSQESARPTFDSSEFAFSVSMTESPELPDDYELLDILPEDEPIYVRNHRSWTFDRAPTIKYRKHRIDGETEYELVGLDDDRKTNLSALKLTYQSRTGMFKGSFTLYASNECCTERMPRIKKYKASVKGVMIDEEGYGTATVKIGSKTYRWPVTIESAD